MPLASTPKSVSAVIVGSDYNELREDLLVNHAHKGNRDGTKTDHVDLLNKGTRTHDQLDAQMTGLQSTVPFQKMFAIGYKSDSITSGPGWTSTIGEYNGSEGKRIVITFSPALPSPPIVTCTMLPGNDNWNNNGGYDIYSSGSLAVESSTTTTVTIDYVRLYAQSYALNKSYPTPDPFRMNIIGVCP